MKEKLLGRVSLFIHLCRKTDIPISVKEEKEHAML